MSVNQAQSRKFSGVYEENYELLCKVAYRISGRVDIAEEVVQEAFIKYLERIDDLPGDVGARYWLIRVVKNLSLNHEKRKGRERKAVERFGREPKRSGEPEGEKQVMAEESLSEVQQALGKLPEKLRTVLVLKEYIGFPYSEIGEILGITEGNVKVRVFRARAQLAKYFEKGDWYAP
jgi:RNA polymerase sigma-70 factor (ECF subfamily)